MTRSNIEWTDATWNPVVGCTRVSPACDHCYAVTMSHRLEAMAEAKAAAGKPRGGLGWYVSLTVLNNKGDRHFNGRVECVPERLDEPLRWRAPRMVFTASMSDIFHSSVPFEFLDQIFARMALTPQHTYQVLTKRPERMAEWFARRDGSGYDTPKRVEWHMVGRPGCPDRFDVTWPLPNVWLGTTVEDQARADERIPHLLRCPAAVRFVSCEPLLAEIDLTTIAVPSPKPITAKDPTLGNRAVEPMEPSHGWVASIDCLRGTTRTTRGIEFGRSDGQPGKNRLHWVIAGGETAPAAKARPTDDAWLRSLRDQCRAAGVPFFLKQRTERGRKIPIEQWPGDLRVREWPEAGRAATA